MKYEQRELPLGDERQKRLSKVKFKVDYRGPKFLRANFDIEPLPAGTLITARYNLPSIGLETGRGYRITGYKQRRQVPNCDFERYFYSVDGINFDILLDYIQLAGPVCKTP